MQKKSDDSESSPVSSFQAFSAIHLLLPVLNIPGIREKQYTETEWSGPGKS
jgi:hypothetical protein